jgi:hypothetical protein
VLIDTLIVGPWRPVLEDELAAWLVRSRDTGRPALALARDANLRRHLLKTLVLDRGMDLWGVEISTLGGFLRAVTAGEGGAGPWSPAAVLEACAAAAGERAGVAARLGLPQSASRLLAAFEELARAGAVGEIDPDEVISAAGGDLADPAGTAAVLAAYASFLELKAEHGLAWLHDLPVAAVGAIARTAALDGTPDVCLYGFDDMTPPQEDAVDAIAARSRLSIMVPAVTRAGVSPGSEGAVTDCPRSCRYAVPLLERLVGRSREIQAPAVAPAAPYALFSRAWLDGIPGVETMPGPRIEAASVTGIDGELAFAAREIRGLHDRGMAFDDVLVVARDLDAYRERLAAVFAEHEIPVAAAVTPRPERRRVAEAARAFLDLATRRGSAACVLSLLSNPLFRGHGTVDLPSAAALVRRLGIADRREWLRIGVSLPPDDDEGTEDALEAARGGLAAIVLPLLADLEGDAAVTDPAEHARAWSRRVRERLAEPADAGVDAAIDELAASVEDLAAIGRVGREMDADAFVEAIRGLVDAFSSELGPSRPARGVGVCNALAARGLSARHVFLLGFTADVFPVARPADPFLPEAVRRALANAVGLRFRSGDDELDREIGLLVTLLSGATECAWFVTRTAEDDGSEVAPSPIVEAARSLLSGGGELPPAVRMPRRPAGVRELALRRGWPPPVPREALEAAVAAGRALHAGVADRPEVAFVASRVDHARGLASWDADAYADGEARPSRGEEDEALRRAASGPWSPESIADHATCPFRYFGRRVLALKGSDLPARTLDFGPAEVSRVVRGALVTLAGRRAVAGALAAGAPFAKVADVADAACDASFSRVLATLPAMPDWCAGVARLLARGALRKAWTAMTGRPGRDGSVRAGSRTLASEGETRVIASADAVLQGREGPGVAVLFQWMKPRHRKDEKVLADLRPERRIAMALAQRHLGQGGGGLFAFLDVQDPASDARVVEVPAGMFEDELAAVPVQSAAAGKGNFRPRPGTECDRCPVSALCRRSEPQTAARLAAGGTNEGTEGEG